MRLRSAEQPDQVIGPVRFRKGPNQSELACRSCGDLYFVDDISFHDAMSAMEMGLESSFYCDECEAEVMNSRIRRAEPILGESAQNA